MEDAPRLRDLSASFVAGSFETGTDSPESQT